jgi:hypothetical protein
MKLRGNIRYATLLVSVIACAGILYAQTTAPEKPFVVNGKAMGTVLEVGNRSYVDVETVAQIMNGSVTIETNRILLNTAGPETAKSLEPRATPAPSRSSGLSREFSRAAIAELAEMREWRGAVGAILTYGVPVVGTWPQDYHDRVSASLDQVGVAATTDSDRQALDLLRHNFDNLAQWADGVVATRNNLNATKTVSPNAMQNDPALAQITDCSRFLSSMLVSGSYADNPSCH